MQGCRGELDTHIHSLEEFIEGFRSLMPLLSSKNPSIHHLLRDREVKTEAAGASVGRKKEAEEIKGVSSSPGGVI